MKTKLLENRFIIFTLLCVLVISGLSSCSSFKRTDDAVRIKPEYSQKYNQNPYTKEMRNGLALRGSVLKIVKKSYPNSCPLDSNRDFTTHTYVAFIDSSSASEDDVELIPIEAVDLIAPKIDMPSDVYVFENYNDPLNPKSVREVIIDSSFVDTCKINCKCGQIGLPGIALDLPPCPKREYSWFFIELRAAYAAYNDYESPIEEKGRESWLGELAAGFRFGGAKEWGLGLAFNYGLKAYNSYQKEDVTRPVLMLHGRWQSPNDRFFGMCMKPFIYAQFGMAIDDLTIKLGNMKINDQCDMNDELDLAPNVDMSLPISYGIGIGMDIPLSSFMDLSADIGYRSIAFGETTEALGFTNVPTMRRINMFILRFGLTF